MSGPIPYLREVITMGGADNVNWYAIATRSRHEKVVHHQLEGKQIESFLPIVSRWSRWNDRRKKIEVPLFSGYCFARFAVAGALPVLQCAGVVRIVSCAGKPAPVAAHEIHSLRLAVAAAAEPCSLLTEGMMIEVIAGPLRGVVGRLQRHDPRRATVVLSVELIGQAVRVEVNSDDIAPL